MKTKFEEMYGISPETTRALLNNSYFFLIEDTARTFNLNMHTFECKAISMEEALGKMYSARPEFKGRKIERTDVTYSLFLEKV